MNPFETNKTVLVVEDDRDMRELCVDALSSAGLNVIAATDGQEGVTMAFTHHPAVILMDIQMPVLSGHDAVQKIRQDEWGKTVKVIYLTNFSDPRDVVAAFELGGEEYLIKAHTSIKDIVNRVRIAMHT